MGIIVTAINKQGNKIIDYSCELDGSPFKLTRDQMIKKINNKEVDNARIQVYKEQIIIRVNIEGAIKQKRKSKNSDNITSENTSSTSKQNNKSSNSISSRELMVSIAKEFNIRNISPFMERFLEKHPALRTKTYTDENLYERVTDTKLITKFWVLVAQKQISDAKIKVDKELENYEFMLYCKQNGIHEE